MVSAVTCLESQSTSAFSPRYLDDPVLRTARERVLKFKEYLTDHRFGLGTTSDGVKMWHMQPHDEPLVARGHTVIKNITSLELVVEALTNNDRLREWNTDIVETRVINKLTFPYGCEQVVKEYAAFKGRMGFPGRDCVWHSYTVWENNETVFVIYFSDQSASHAVESVGRYVRAHVLISGYRVDRTAEGISVHFVNQVDPGAKLVPEWILNTVMKRTPERLAALSAYIHFADKEKKK